MNRPDRRRAAALAAGILLLLPWLASATPSHRISQHSGPAIAQSSPSLVHRLWESLRALWGDEGTSIDPDGIRRSPSSIACVSKIPAPEGTSIDPSGACTASH